MDPLRCLRDAVLSKTLDSVVVRDENVLFADQFSFPRKIETSYKSQRGNAAFYDLESLLYFIKEGCNMATSTYLREARNRNLMTVSFVDRKDVQEYLQGDIDKSEYIRIDVPKLPASEPGEQDGLESSKRKRDEQGDAPVLMSTKVGGQSHRPLQDRNSVLCTPKHTFQRALDVLSRSKSKSGDARPGAAAAPPPSLDGTRPPSQPASRPTEPHKHSTGASAAPHHPSSRAAPGVKPSSSEHKAGGTPIIIVPSGFGANVLINMFNCKKYLEQGVFETWETAKASGVKKVSTQTMYRTFGRAKPVMYTITDRPPPLDSSDWARVVAVFTNGAKWQFKDWPFNGAADGDLVETFHRVKAFHVKYQEIPLPAAIKTWNITAIDVHRYQRHMDGANLESFWKAVDSFLHARRSTLKY